MPDPFAGLLRQSMVHVGLIQKRLTFLALDRTDPRRFVRLHEEVDALQQYLQTVADKTGVSAPEEVKG